MADTVDKTKKKSTVDETKWQRINALVEINQYDKLNEIAYRNRLSMAETLRIFLNIGFAILDNKIDLAIRLANQLPNKDNQH